MANPFAGTKRPLQIQAAAFPTWNEAGPWQAVAGAAAQDSAGGWSWSIPAPRHSPGGGPVAGTRREQRAPPEPSLTGASGALV